MHKPTWFQANLTLGNIVTLGAMLVALSVGYGRLDNRIETLGRDQARVETAANEKFASIARSLENLPNLSYRITAAEEGLKATNARLDASLQTLSSRIAEMNQLLGGMDTKLAVMNQRLEQVVPDRRADAQQVRPK